LLDCYGGICEATSCRPLIEISGLAGFFIDGMSIAELWLLMVNRSIISKIAGVESRDAYEEGEARPTRTTSCLGSKSRERKWPDRTEEGSKDKKCLLLVW
jgi:hypothetical protein